MVTIYNLGSINIDHVYRLAHLPAAGETIAAREYGLGLGGKGANQSIAVASAGARVVHIGAIAAERRDDWVLDRLAESGVDISGVSRLAYVATGHAVILVNDQAENLIVLHPGANQRLEKDSIHAALAGIGPSDTLMLQNETNLQHEAAMIARAAGARVIYSAAPFDAERVHALLPHVTMLAVNEVEAAQLSETTPKDTPLPAMLITRGAEGAEYSDPASNTRLRVPAFDVMPVDTTGAGDCFAGYFAAGLDLGRDVEDALTHAAAAAAIKVTRRGAGDSIPEAAEVLDFLKSNPKVR